MNRLSLFCEECRTGCWPHGPGRIRPGRGGQNWTIRPSDGIRAQRFLEPASLMKLFFLKLFTWWNGQTFGTQLWTWRFGELVGKDEQGNLYYRTKGAQDRSHARLRAALGGL